MKYLLYYILGLITGFLVFIFIVKYSPDSFRYTFLNLIDVEVEIS